MKARLKQLGRILLLCGLSTAAIPGWAATATAPFGVSATVVPACTVIASALNFGTTMPTSITANMDTTTTITATCSSGAPYTIALTAGTGPGATMAQRKMMNGANSFVYSLYMEAGRTTVWGDGTAGSAMLSNTGSGTAQAITVFARIPSGQSVATGSYSDMITVSVNF